MNFEKGNGENVDLIKQDLIDLFTDCKTNNKKSKRILKMLFQNQVMELTQRDLQQQLFRGLMRKFVELKFKMIKRQTTKEKLIEKNKNI